MEKLDGICTKLIAIGEGLKNIDKVTNNSLLPNYSEINWKGAQQCHCLGFFDPPAKQRILRPKP
jgi:hypothetical protein